MFAPENVEKYKDEITLLQQHAREVSKEAVIAALHGMKLRKSGIGILVKSQCAHQIYTG